MSQVTNELLKTYMDSTSEALMALKENNNEKFNHFSEESAKSLESIGCIKTGLDDQKKAIQDMEVKLDNFNGGQIKTCAPEEYKERFDLYLRRKSPQFSKGMLDEALDWSIMNSKAVPLFVTKKGVDIFKKDVLEGINPQGGYWILPEHSAQDIIKFYESNPLRQLCSNLTTGTNVLKMIIDDRLAESGGWVGEVTPITSTATSRIGELSIAIHQQFAEPKASVWMLDDVQFDLVSWVSNKTTQIFNLFENSAFLAGDGSQKPTGILSYDKWGGAAVDFGNDANYERQKLEYIASGENGGFTYKGLTNIQGSLLEQYQPNATWLTTRQGWARILQIVDNQDRPIINPLNILAEGQMPLLLGKPVRMAAQTQEIPQGTTTSSLPGFPPIANFAVGAIYGDFKAGYSIVDRIGMVTITDIVTEKQFVKYYSRKRLGGALTSYQSLKVLELTLIP